MLTSSNILTELFIRFTSFKEKMAYNPDELLPYNILGDFALDFQNRLAASELSKREIDNFFDFANEMADSSDEEVKNILVAEIFEIFSDKQETIQLAREKMNNSGKQLLERILKGWI